MWTPYLQHTCRDKKREPLGPFLGDEKMLESVRLVQRDFRIMIDQQ